MDAKLKRDLLEGSTNTKESNVSVYIIDMQQFSPRSSTSPSRHRGLLADNRVAEVLALCKQQTWAISRAP